MELADDGSVFQDPGLVLFGSANAQDAWVFAAPFDVPNSDFELGTMRDEESVGARGRG